jgi:crotonobetainyl-CoA:carnitine CoA-transferase CaiB-like acyl-CoA transferase
MLPLSRFKVLDLTLARAGPSAARHLADWGADVIRIEPPKTLSAGSASFDDRFGSDQMNLNRNKRGITLNLKDPKGLAIFMKLAAEADVIIENMRVNVKHRLGIDYESVRKVNPRIVYGSISGYGQTGPYKDFACVDQVMQGFAGLMSVTGLPGQGPVRAGIAVADMAAGAFLVQGILAALLEREVTGVGRWVHTSLLEALIGMMDFQAARWLVSGVVAGQAGNDHPTFVPSGVFPSSDGQILIGTGGEALWQRFCGLLDAEHFLKDPRYVTNEVRLLHREELNADIAALTRTRTTQHWFELMNEGGIPCGPVNTIDKVFADPQVKHVGIAVKGSVPDLGEITFVGQPANIDGVEKSIRLPPPALGAHTDDVLRDLKFSDAEIAELRREHVV